MSHPEEVLHSLCLHFATCWNESSTKRLVWVGLVWPQASTQTVMASICHLWLATQLLWTISNMGWRRCRCPIDLQISQSVCRLKMKLLKLRSSAHYIQLQRCASLLSRLSLLMLGSTLPWRSSAEACHRPKPVR